MLLLLVGVVDEVLPRRLVSEYVARLSRGRLDGVLLLLLVVALLLVERARRLALGRLHGRSRGGLELLERRRRARLLLLLLLLACARRRRRDRRMIVVLNWTSGDHRNAAHQRQAGQVTAVLFVRSLLVWRGDCDCDCEGEKIELVWRLI